MKLGLGNIEEGSLLDERSFKVNLKGALDKNKMFDDYEDYMVWVDQSNNQFDLRSHFSDSRSLT